MVEISLSAGLRLYYGVLDAQSYTFIPMGSLDLATWDDKSRFNAWGGYTPAQS